MYPEGCRRSCWLIRFQAGLKEGHPGVFLLKIHTAHEFASTHPRFKLTNRNLTAVNSGWGCGWWGSALGFFVPNTRTPTTPQPFPCFFSFERIISRFYRILSALSTWMLTICNAWHIFASTTECFMIVCLSNQRIVTAGQPEKDIQKNIFSKSYLIIIHFPHSPPTDSFHENTNQLNLLCSTGHFDFIIFPGARASRVDPRCDSGLRWRSLRQDLRGTDQVARL